MTTNSVAVRVSTTNPALPILVGGAIAGLLDMTSAYITYGRMMPLGIAGGLIGAAARHPAVGTYILGLAIHYLIAFSAAAAYCLASRKLTFLRESFFVCGLVFGIVFFLFMNLVVLPLSAYHAMGPYTYRGLVQGLLAHMFLRPADFNQFADVTGIDNRPGCDPSSSRNPKTMRQSASLFFVGNCF